MLLFEVSITSFFQQFIFFLWCVWQAMEAQQQPEPWETDADYEDPEDYLNDEDQFNITDRLIVLFPLLDINPHDGFVSVKELQDWHWLQGQNALQHRTDREMDVHDKNNDGLITFKEYLPHLTEEEIGTTTCLALSTHMHGQ
jgi:hypothetical protein